MTGKYWLPSPSVPASPVRNTLRISLKVRPCLSSTGAVRRMQTRAPASAAGSVAACHSRVTSVSRLPGAVPDVLGQHLVAPLAVERGAVLGQERRLAVRSGDRLRDRCRGPHPAVAQRGAVLLRVRVSGQGRAGQAGHHVGLLDDRLVDLPAHRVPGRLVGRHHLAAHEPDDLVALLREVVTPCRPQEAGRTGQHESHAGEPTDSGQAAVRAARRHNRSIVAVGRLIGPRRRHNRSIAAVGRPMTPDADARGPAVRVGRRALRGLDLAQTSNWPASRRAFTSERNRAASAPSTRRWS